MVLEGQVNANRIFAAERYEERATVQAGLSRVHDRFDVFREDIHRRLDNQTATLVTQINEMHKNVLTIVSGRRKDD